MTQFAEHVYTEQRDIARIESWAEQLEDEARVEIRLADGARVEGFVTARPTIPVFRDGEGRGGMNAMVRIDDQANPEHAHYLWLDRSIDIRRTGPTCASRERKSVVQGKRVSVSVEHGYRRINKK